MISSIRKLFNRTPKNEVCDTKTSVLSKGVSIICITNHTLDNQSYRSLEIQEELDEIKAMNSILV